MKSSVVLDRNLKAGSFSTVRITTEFIFRKRYVDECIKKKTISTQCTQIIRKGATSLFFQVELELLKNLVSVQLKIPKN